MPPKIDLNKVDPAQAERDADWIRKRGSSDLFREAVEEDIELSIKVEEELRKKERNKRVKAKLRRQRRRND